MVTLHQTACRLGENFLKHKRLYLTALRLKVVTENDKSKMSCWTANIKYYHNTAAFDSYWK